jgi:two-component system phosphate regulon sensor histidine kinase PhoR
MKRSKFQLILLILTLASLVALVGIQITWIIKAARIQEAQFNHSVTMAMNRIIENLARDKAICKEVSNCLREGNSGSCYLLMKNREEWANIKSVIKNDLNYYGITLDFEFDIVDINHNATNLPDKEIYLSENLEKILEQSGFKLSIRFPEKRDFIIAQVGNIFIFSIILLFIVTLSFIMIFRYYRKEKQLAENIVDFVNNMTHEFKTPLTNISLANSMISKNENVEKDEKLSFYSNVIRSEHNKLKERVEKLLKTSFSETDRPSLKELIDAATVSENIIETFNVQVNQKGGSISLTKTGNNFNIYGNMDLFHIAIGNIVDNAIKYCRKVPEILINLRSSENFLSIDIEDNGPGIPKEYQDLIFDKYYRIPTHDVQENNGFGLGLYQVKNIIVKMGGKIKVTNLKGKGLRLSIELPLAINK